MDIDGNKLEQTVLALLYLNSFQEGEGKRAWKGFPWTVMDALHEKGYISIRQRKTSPYGYPRRAPSSLKNCSRSCSP